MEKRNKIIIATRGSKLALWQAEWIKSQIENLIPDINVELNKIKTTGDKILDVPLAQVGGKGLFVKEIEEAMLRGFIFQPYVNGRILEMPLLQEKVLVVSAIFLRADMLVQAV